MTQTESNGGKTKINWENSKSTGRKLKSTGKNDIQKETKKTPKTWENCKELKIRHENQNQWENAKNNGRKIIR